MMVEHTVSLYTSQATGEQSCLTQSTESLVVQVSSIPKMIYSWLSRGWSDMCVRSSVDYNLAPNENVRDPRVLRLQ